MALRLSIRQAALRCASGSSPRVAASRAFSVASTKQAAWNPLKGQENVKDTSSMTNMRVRPLISPPYPIQCPTNTPFQHEARDPQPTKTVPIVNPSDKYREKGEQLHTYGQYLMSCLPKYIQQFSVWKDDLILYIPPAGVIPVFTFLKYHTSAEYTQVSDITAVDYPTKDQRFEVVYNLLSVRHNSRIRVKTYADEATPVPSVCSLYDGARCMICFRVLCRSPGSEEDHNGLWV